MKQIKIVTSTPSVIRSYVAFILDVVVVGFFRGKFEEYAHFTGEVLFFGINYFLLHLSQLQFAFNRMQCRTVLQFVTINLHPP